MVVSNTNLEFDLSDYAQEEFCEFIGNFQFEIRPNRVDYFEARALKNVIYVHSALVRQELERELGEDQVQVALDEWYYLAICPDEFILDKDDLVYFDLLNELIKSKIKIYDINKDEVKNINTWNDLINHELAKYQEAILIGIELSWSWLKVYRLVLSNELIASCLARGYSPDLTTEEYIETIEAETEKKRKRCQELRQQSIKNLRVCGIELPNNASSIEVERALFKYYRKQISDLLTIPQDDIADDLVRKCIDELNSNS